MKHVRQRIRIAGLSLAFLLLSCSTSYAWRGKVIELEDGDSGKVLKGWDTIEFRLYGIDAPEHGQPFSGEAKMFASRRLLWKEIELRTLDVDQYGRQVVLAYRDGKCINEQMVEAGYAWVYRSYCKESFCGKWTVLEKQARGKRVGLWKQNNPTPPWQHRQKNNEAMHSPNVVDALIGFLSLAEYHGNVSSKIFHRRKCEHFNCKNCTARFSTRDEAIQAGFKPCSSCKP